MVVSGGIELPSSGIVVTVHRVQALIEALEVQAEMGRRVRPSQLDLRSPCPGWSVSEGMSHSIGVTLKFAEFASGATDQPRTASGDLVGPRHCGDLRSAADAARAAWMSADTTRYVPKGTDDRSSSSRL